MKIPIVVPVYNSPYINEVLDDLHQLNYEIIVVDDGSTPMVNSSLESVTILRHPQNMGKGEAILTAAKYIQQKGYSSFVTFDGDKQHLSSEIAKLLAAYKENSIIIGNRDFNSENVPNSSKFGRKFSNFWVFLETFKSLGDTQSGLRIYPTSIIELNIKNRRFDFEIEVLALHAYKGGDIIDVDVACYYPPQEERVSHFDKVKDNIRLTKIHTRLMIERYLFLRGWLWE
jgi:glycosyltransferase involved in cell wall biosynthesis